MTILERFGYQSISPEPLTRGRKLQTIALCEQIGCEDLLRRCLNFFRPSFGSKSYQYRVETGFEVTKRLAAGANTLERVACKKFRDSTLSRKFIISIKKTNISIEILNISIEKANVSIEKLNIFIKKVNISIEKLNIPIEKTILFIKKVSVSIKKINVSIKKPKISIEKRLFLVFFASAFFKRFGLFSRVPIRFS